MAIDSTTPRTRRAILAAVAGGLAATAVTSLERAQPVAAVVTPPVLLGADNETDSPTKITNLSNDATVGTVFTAATQGSGTAVNAFSTNGTGVNVHSGFGQGVFAISEQGTAAAIEGWAGLNTGVQGQSGEKPISSPANTGVYGYAITDASSRGVTGQASAGRGVNGVATTGTGVHGTSTSGEGMRGTSSGSNGVAGSSASSVASGVYGENTHGGAGTYGRSNKTGGNGAFGESSLGIGVHGTTDTGTGGYFSASHGGIALHTSGRVQLDNSSGIATVAAGSRSISVAPGIDLTVHSAVVATLMGNAGGTTTVQHVLVNPTTNQFTINLTKATPDGVKVAWHVFG